MPIPRTRGYTGPALFSYGFRPFFLAGAIYAAASIAVWLPAWFGNIILPTHFAPVEWHVHELLFGFLPAIVTGFLFTAVPNWTGRMPLQGAGLIVLVALWIAGRLAVLMSQWIGWQAAMMADCAFLLAVALVIAREIVSGGNWRNLKVLIPLGILTGANALFHWQVVFADDTLLARRLAFAAATLLIVIIGGRIVPSFTRNWMVRENPGRLPTSFGPFDKLAIGVTSLALAGWIVLPEKTVTALSLVASGVMQLLRLARWAGYRTLRDPLVWILHAAYALLSVGMMALGMAILAPEAIPPAVPYHLLGVGAFGTMTLAVMVRAARGHTGQELRAGAGGKLAFAAILLATVARLSAEYAPAAYVGLLYLAATFWIVAYAAFAVTLGPALSRPRGS
ncbi:NnrS family protein [Tepidamorphus sp. 3E244]|uniref:NnrS family protein n=1 Tax=Tepidamorphus sp. 3E244 TaxID=3385498 RepID=UPI0038FD3BE3